MKGKGFTRVLALAASGALAFALAALLAGCGSGSGKDEAPVVAVVTADEAAAMMESDPGLVILDVRASAGFAMGHIPGAVNIDFKGEDFEAALAALDRDARYLVYCGGGEASAAAAGMMAGMGFRHVSILDGGYTEWVKQQRPTTKD